MICKKLLLIATFFLSALVYAQNPEKKFRDYIDKNDWESLKQSLPSSNLEALSMSGLYYQAANKIIEQASGHLPYAEDFAARALGIAKEEAAKSSGNVGGRGKGSIAWNVYYPRYMDTYAKVLYKEGKYQEGFKQSKETALQLGKGEYAAYNETYTLLAEKVLPEAEFKKEAERFVREAKATPVVKQALKRLYVKQTKTEAGFDKYILDLQQDLYNRMLTDLKKTMLGNKAPQFSLAGKSGKTISMAGLKGKVVIVDFWSSWCAPCKASFPAMQRVVTKYKNDPDVLFFFIDTWENIPGKKSIPGDYVAEHGFTFHVLYDKESKVVSQFGVSGIPTKFVIDKNGTIRFRSVDFKEYEDDKLYHELSAMIELAKESSK